MTLSDGRADPRQRPQRAARRRRGSALALVLWGLLLALVLLGGCQRRAVDRLVDDSLVHLEAAERLMQEAAGDEFKLREAVMLYRAEHGQEFSRLRAQGEAQLAALSEEERRSVAVQAKQRADALLAKLQLQAQRFPDSRRALVLVRPLVVAGTPKMAAGTRPNWVPPPPAPPPMLDLPGAATAAGAPSAPAPGYAPVSDGPVPPGAVPAQPGHVHPEH